MNLLAISTSSNRASVALFQKGQFLHEESSQQQRTHSDWVHPALIKTLQTSNLKVADIDGFAVDVGPGSFTGIRVGLNLVKSLAFACQKPVFQFSSLDILLSDLPLGSYALINAFKNSVYLAGQDLYGKPAAPSVVPVKSLVEWLNQIPNPEQITLIGDALTSVPSIRDLAKARPFLLRSSPELDYPCGKRLGVVATLIDESGWTKDWKSIIPLYLRASEAEENLGKG